MFGLRVVLYLSSKPCLTSSLLCLILLLLEMFSFKVLLSNTLLSSVHQFHWNDKMESRAEVAYTALYIQRPRFMRVAQSAYSQKGQLILRDGRKHRLKILQYASMQKECNMHPTTVIQLVAFVFHNA